MIVNYTICYTAPVCHFDFWRSRTDLPYEGASGNYDNTALYRLDVEIPLYETLLYDFTYIFVTLKEVPK